MIQSKASKWLFVLITICALSFNASSQERDSTTKQLEEIANDLDEKGQYEASRSYWLKAAEIHLSNKNWNGYFNARAYYVNSFSILSQMEEVDAEMRDIRAQLDSLKKAYPSFVFDTIDVIVRRFDLKSKIEQNDLQSAEAISRSIIKEFEQIDNKSGYDNQILIEQYFRLGQILIKKGSFENALEYSGKAVNMIEVNGYLEDYRDQGSILNAFMQNADCHLALRDTSNLLLEFDRLKTHLELLETKVDERSFAVYQRIFNYYLDQKNADSSQYYLELLLKIRSFRKEAIYHQAKYTATFETSGTSIPVISQAAQVIREEFGLRHTLHIDLLLELAQLYFEQGALDNCLEEIDKIFQLITQTKLEEFKDEQMAIDQNGPLIVQLLQLKVDVFLAYFQQSGDLTFLQQAWELSQQTIKTLENIRNSYMSEADQIFLLESSYGIYEKAIEITYAFFNSDKEDTKGWIDTAFELMEKSKSVNLLEATLHQKAMQIAGLPDSIPETELNLRLQILKLQEDIFDMQQQTVMNRQLFSEKQSQIVDLKNAYQELIDRVDSQFPVFAKLRNRIESSSLDTLETQMRAEDKGLIEFFYGSRAVYMIASNGSENGFFRIEGVDTLDQVCNDLISSIKTFGLEPSQLSIQHYVDNSFALFKSTLGQIEFQLPEKIRIVPDGPLRAISFSSLLTSLPKKEMHLYEYPYALHKYQFSYVYSFAFQAELKNQNMERPEIRLHAFSPNFPSKLRSEYPDEIAIDSLLYNDLEVQAINRFLPTIHFRNEQATKTAFFNILVKNFNEASILHIASHGVADQQYGQLSFIRFASDRPDHPKAKLSARELYALQLPYNMVFLSACETAAGEVKRGEGIVGLARGFFYSGVKSMITTLWNISDEASVTLVTHFYKNLKRGQTKGDALRNAQINFIEDQRKKKEKIKSHPFYWAAFIPIGDMGNMQFIPFYKTPLFFAGVMISIFCICALLWRRKLNRKRS